MYEKTAVAFNYLEKYLGTQTFDRAMQAYYRQYEFKHPQPEDLRRVLETETGKDLEWFFDQLLATDAKLDYAIKKVDQRAETIGTKSYDKITIRQGKAANADLGEFNMVKGPFPISAVKDGKVVKTIWYEGFNGTMDVLFDSPEAYDELVIDYPRNLPEMNRRNNNWHPGGLCKKGEPLRFQFLGSLENPRRKQIFYAPLLRSNYYDKLMAGVAFYNTILPNKSIEWTVAPLYAFGNQTFSGSGNIDFNFFPKKRGEAWWQKLQVRITAATFGTGYFNVYDTTEVAPYPKVEEKPTKYYRFSDIVTLTLRPRNPRSAITTQIAHRDVLLYHKQYSAPASTDLVARYDHPFREVQIGELSFSLENKRVINPLAFKVAFQYGENLGLGLVEAKYKLSYNEKKGLNIRVFGGGFLVNDDQNPYLLTFTDKGVYDYLFDDTYMGRYEIAKDQFRSHQVAIRNGGFKVPVSFNSDEYLVAANLSSSLPAIPFVKVYADVGTGWGTDATFLCDFGLPCPGDLFFDAGLAFVFVPDVFEVYLPLVHSKAYEQPLKDYKWYEKITFLLDIKTVSPSERVSKFLF